MDNGDIRHLVGVAGFIFRGTIRKHLKDHTSAIPAEGSETVAVRIEQVLRSTPVLRSLAGQDAFVMTSRASALLESRSPILFSECISLGSQLLLREIAHVEASEETTRQVADAIRLENERPLRERVAGAELIVTGVVLDSGPTESARSPKSEHDPIWWIARLSVKSVLKGRKPAGKLEVLFASSTDREWFKSPKLYRDASGIFLLRQAREEGVPKKVARTAYEAIDPLDFLPIERLAEVERLLAGERGGR